MKNNQLEISLKNQFWDNPVNLVISQKKTWVPGRFNQCYQAKVEVDLHPQFCHYLCAPDLQGIYVERYLC